MQAAILRFRKLPTAIDRALRLLITLRVLIRNDQRESDGQA